MSLILVTSSKGGTGTTTIAARLAEGLAAFGHTPVAIDLTDQALLARHFFPPDDAGEPPAVAHRTIDPATPHGRPRAAFALAQAAPDAVLIADIASGDRETQAALAPHADLILRVFAADAGSLAALAHLSDDPAACCILNRVDERRAFAADMVLLAEALFGDRLLATIRQDEAINEALALMAPPDPASAAAADLAALARRVAALLPAAPAAARKSA